MVLATRSSFNALENLEGVEGRVLSQRLLHQAPNVRLLSSVGEYAATSMSRGGGQECFHIRRRNSRGSCGKSVKVPVCCRYSIAGSRLWTSRSTRSHRQLDPVVIVDRLHTSRDPPCQRQAFLSVEPSAWRARRVGNRVSRLPFRIIGLSGNVEL
jgi:hypothetical protein